MLVEGDTLYAGGTFTVAGTSAGRSRSSRPPTARSCARSAASADGVPIMYNKPPLNAIAVIGDGTGVWYVGGCFDRVTVNRGRRSCTSAPTGGRPAFRADVRAP